MMVSLFYSTSFAFQCLIRISDRDNVIANLQDIQTYLVHNPLTLEIESISWRAESHMFFLEITPNVADYKALEGLQYWVHFLIKQYLLLGSEPDKFCFADENANHFVWDFVRAFPTKYSQENYWPHITLGKSKVDVSKSIPIISFSTASLGLFQLSANGTCIKNHWL